jgi:hypothetical protein
MQNAIHVLDHLGSLLAQQKVHEAEHADFERTKQVWENIRQEILALGQKFLSEGLVLAPTDRILPSAMTFIGELKARIADLEGQIGELRAAQNGHMDVSDVPPRFASP